MARPQKQSDQPDPSEDGSVPVSEQVTYLPGEGDPPSTKWHGIVFHAHAPKTVTKPQLIEQARGNRFFKVGDFDPARDLNSGARVVVTDPKTPMEYRAHFVAWFKKATNINDLVSMWAKEEPMRVTAEVGADDYSYIGALFHPKMHEFAKMAGLNDKQLAELWAQHGVYQLPF